MMVDHGDLGDGDALIPDPTVSASLGHRFLRLDRGRSATLDLRVQGSHVRVEADRGVEIAHRGAHGTETLFRPYDETRWVRSERYEIDIVVERSGLIQFSQAPDPTGAVDPSSTVTVEATSGTTLYFRHLTIAPPPPPPRCSCGRGLPAGYCPTCHPPGT